MLIIIACVVVLVVLFYVEENWRGKHAWETYKRQREAKGDSFEWSSVVPPPVPDDQNFAAIPLFAELFPKPPTHPRLEAAHLPDCTNALGNWRVGRTEDLSVWRACFTNTDLLAALSKYGPVLSEITEASRRSYCRFPLRYEDNDKMLLPHLSHLRHLTGAYRLRALVELSNGRADAAFDDVQTCLRLAGTIKHEPLIIPFLVRVALIDLGTQPIWEGLAAHCWDDNQLAALQASFENMDQFGSFDQAIHGERLLASHTVQWLQAHPEEAFEWSVFMQEESPSIRLRRWFGLPSACFYHSELSVDQFYTEMFLPTIDFGHQRISPKAVAAASASIPAILKNPYNALSGLFISPREGELRKLALSQSGVQEVAVACALERYRLGSSQLPDRLDSLVPQFLTRVPRDVIDGQLLRYRRTTVDQFVLYSIGWNEHDDGGQIAWKKDEPRKQDLEAGDWTWFSQPQPSASERK